MMLVYLSDNVNCRFGFSMPFDVVSWCKLRTTAKYKYKLHLYPSRAKETESPILIIYCRLFRSFTTKFLCSSFVRYSLGSNSSVDISKMDGKAILESHLGKLLGYDDGVSDMLDHLLSIESREDLLEYLLQLLGDAKPEVIEFVDNIARFQNGEKVVRKQRKENDAKPPANEAVNNSTARNKKQQSSPPVAKGNQNQNKKLFPPRSKDKVQSYHEQQEVPSARKSQSPKRGENNNDSSSSQPAMKPKRQDAAAVAAAATNDPPVVKSRPTKGKPKIVCGCFGTKHKPLTNCLYCGRITCVKEGYDFCGYCGYLVEEIIQGQDHHCDQAWIQKERLLRFDREFARRTEIFDDQADYQGPKTWMTEDEIYETEQAESRHMESLKRPKQTLRLNI